MTAYVLTYMDSIKQLCLCNLVDVQANVCCSEHAKKMWLLMCMCNIATPGSGFRELHNHKHCCTVAVPDVPFRLSAKQVS